MPRQKTSEIRELPVEELVSKLDEAKEEIFNLRFQLATGQLDNYRQLRAARREVARLQTLVREREIQDVEEQGDRS